MLPNGQADVHIGQIYDIHYLLYTYGSVYAYYRGEDSVHMVVVTGLDLETGIVYTNNPWGISGEQTFDEFMNGYVGLGSGKNSKMSHSAC